MTVLDAFRSTYRLTDGASPRTTSAAGRRELLDLLATMGVKTGAEVGVWTGLFSKQMCEAITGLQLTCIDPWQAYDAYRERKNDQAKLDAAYQDARARLAPYGCRIWRKTSAEAAAAMPDRSLDFVYVDANHLKPFVLEDLALWMPKVKVGGILAGHDYIPWPAKRAKSPWIEVQAAVDEFASARGIGPVYVLAADKAPSYFWVVS